MRSRGSHCASVEAHLVPTLYKSNTRTYTEPQKYNYNFFTNSLAAGVLFYTLIQTLAPCILTFAF